MQWLKLFFIIALILFCPVFVFGAIAITPPNNFIGDGTLSGGTTSLIKINIVDEESGIYYLKSYFYPPSKTSARFGYVWNPTTSQWVSAYQKNSEQLQIEITPDGQWNGTLSIKTDIEKSGYLGPGEYVLKVRATPMATGKVIEISTKTSIIEPSAKSQASTLTLSTSTSPENAVNLADRQGSLQTKEGPTTSQAPEQVVNPNPPPKNYPSNIFLSEILPSPEGSDTENEFVELFNGNNFEADISGFKIKDKIGVVKTFTIPAGTKISANGFLAFKNSQTKISLNNTGDRVELLDPTGKIINSTDFGKSQQGQSWSKNETGWQWSIQTTPNQANVIVAISTNATSNLNTATSSIKNNLTANIQNYPAQRKNFLAVGIATAIALSSAIIAWRIKKNSTEV